MPLTCPVLHEQGCLSKLHFPDSIKHAHLIWMVIGPVHCLSNAYTTVIGPHGHVVLPGLQQRVVPLLRMTCCQYPRASIMGLSRLQ